MIYSKFYKELLSMKPLNEMYYGKSNVTKNIENSISKLIRFFNSNMGKELSYKAQTKTLYPGYANDSKFITFDYLIGKKRNYDENNRKSFRKLMFYIQMILDKLGENAINTDYVLKKYRPLYNIIMNFTQQLYSGFGLKIIPLITDLNQPNLMITPIYYMVYDYMKNVDQMFRQKNIPGKPLVAKNEPFFITTNSNQKIYESDFYNIIISDEYGLKIDSSRYEITAILIMDLSLLRNYNVYKYDPSIQLLSCNLDASDLLSIILHEIGHCFCRLTIPPDILNKTMKTIPEQNAFVSRVDEMFADKFVSLYGYAPNFIKTMNILDNAIGKVISFNIPSVPGIDKDKFYKSIRIYNELINRSEKLTVSKEFFDNLDDQTKKELINTNKLTYDANTGRGILKNDNVDSHPLIKTRQYSVLGHLKEERKKSRYLNSDRKSQLNKDIKTSSKLLKDIYPSIVKYDQKSKQYEMNQYKYDPKLSKEENERLEKEFKLNQTANYYITKSIFKDKYSDEVNLIHQDYNPYKHYVDDRYITNIFDRKYEEYLQRRSNK